MTVRVALAALLASCAPAASAPSTHAEPSHAVASDGGMDAALGDAGPSSPSVPTDAGDPIDASSDASPEADAWPDLSLEGGLWEAQRLANPDARPDAAHLDSFGKPVAISGDGTTLLVAGPADDSPGPNPSWNYGYDNSGAVHVFERTADGWQRTQVLKASNAARNSDFGQGLAMDRSGDLALVGAPFGGAPTPGGTAARPLDMVDGGVRDHSGAAYIFVREDGRFRELQMLDLTDAPGHYDRFGEYLDVSADGETLVVSAWERQHPDADPALDARGSALVYERQGERYALVQELRSHREIGGDRFGWTVAVSAEGTRIAVGASSPFYNQFAQALEVADRRVEIFVREAGEWVREAILRPEAGMGELGAFGTALDFGPAADVLAVGEYSYSASSDSELGESGTAVGRAHVFYRDGSSWRSVATLMSPMPVSSGFYGRSVAFAQDARILAVGAGYEHHGLYDPSHTTGAVYLYALGQPAAPAPALIWSHVEPGAQGFGQVVAMSQSGTTLVAASEPTGQVEYDGAYLFEWAPADVPTVEDPAVEDPVLVQPEPTLD